MFPISFNALGFRKGNMSVNGDENMMIPFLMFQSEDL